MQQPLLKVSGLNVGFETNRGLLRPVRDVSFSIFPGPDGRAGGGERVREVGDGAVDSAADSRAAGAGYCGGEILFEGRDLLTLTEREMRSVRGKDIAMIFQEPMTSLNPVYTIGDQIAEAVMLHQHVSAHARRMRSPRKRCTTWASPTRIGGSTSIRTRCPGGMRQRVMIAMALSCQPEAADRRRADDGAGCDDSGADPRIAPQAPEANGAWRSC